MAGAVVPVREIVESHPSRVVCVIPAGKECISMRRIRFSRHFNWRMMLVRILVNALALIIISLLPDIDFVEPTILRVLFVAVMLGILNAFIKPIVQFLTLRFIFITYGFAVVIINTIILLLLNIVVPNMFQVASFRWALVGGAVMGLITAFLESLFGLQLPILPESDNDPQLPAADPARAFETMLASEVVGSDEALAAEVPATAEPQETAAAAAAAVALAAGDSATSLQEEE